MSKYFSLSNTWEDLKNEKGALNTTLNTGILLSKAVGNVAIFTVTEAIPEMLTDSMKRTKRKLESGELNISDEKREELMKKIDEYERKRSK